MSRLRAAVFLGILTLTLAPHAEARRKPKRADHPAAKPALSPEKAAAVLLLNEGNEAFAKGDYARAADRYNAAYERFPSAKILFNLAETHFLLKQLGPAAEMYDRFVQSASADTAPERLLHARQRLAQLQAVVGQVRVTAMPEQARVTLDGAMVPAERIANRVFVDAGAHQLTAEVEGAPTIQRTIAVDPGKLVSVELTQPKVATPVVLAPVRADPPPAIVAPLPPPPRRSVMRSPAVIAGLTTTVALAAGLIGTGSATLVFHQRYVDPNASASSRDFARRTGEGLQWASEGFLIGTVVAAVATTTIAVVLYRREKRTSRPITRIEGGRIAF